MGLEPISGGEEGVPQRFIGMWSGPANTDEVPDGWTLCDGENVEVDGVEIHVPDLTNRFVVGAGDEYSVDDTGGEREVQLTEDEMPKHTHPLETDFNRADHYGYEGNRPAAADTEASSWQLDDDYATESAGGDEPHENRPPYYALAYIMKL